MGGYEKDRQPKSEGLDKKTNTMKQQLLTIREEETEKTAFTRLKTLRQNSWTNIVGNVIARRRSRQSNLRARPRVLRCARN